MGRPVRISSTSDVAHELGLRPATVQMYARNGRIPFDTTPGGHRRFNLAEVRQALELRASAPSAPPTRARATTGWLVDATELNSWADRRASQDELPFIVRTLVAGSLSEITRSDFRAGEGVAVTGWDGIVDVPAGNQWVPTGLSAWEMGTGEDIARKADSDFNDRTANPQGIEPSDTTFVFVTPRRWSNRDSWAATKRAESVWKDVRALDGDSLEQWLEATPGAHARITKLLGRDPEGAADLESSWSKWANATSPALPPQLVLAGRDEQVDQVWNWLKEREPNVLSVIAESQAEASAFISASILQLAPPERTNALARTLIVNSAQAWDEILARTHSTLILIPTYPSPDTNEAIDAGHHVVIPQDTMALTAGSAMELPRIRQEPAKAALVDAGLTDGRGKGTAQELAQLARRSLPALRRRLAVDGAVERPEWAQPEVSRFLVPAMLAGAWRDDRDADRAILEGLSNRPYADVVEALTAWANHEDPPVRRSGNLWYLASKEDAWLLLFRFVTSEHVQRLQAAAVEVLTAVDPALDLEPGERWAAGIHGKIQPWSSNLRSGLADTLAMIGARDTVLTGGLRGQDIADSAVYAILSRANEDPSGRTWSSLDDVIPLLAEASPAQFLAAVDAGEASRALHAIFDPVAEDDPFASPRHTGLLWALELLAWDPTHLGLAALALSRLAQHDPGGRYANRPINSMREIFLPWIPHTRATMEERLDVIDSVRRAVPDVGWRLMLSILPTLHDTSTGIYAPKWRDGDPDPRQRVTGAELQEHADAIVQRLLQDVGADAQRWSAMIESLNGLPQKQHEAVVAELDVLDPANFDDSGQETIRGALRKLIHHHRRFPKANWSLPTAKLDILQAQLDRFAETDLITRSAWLFSQSATLPRPLGDDFSQEEAEIRSARQTVLVNVLASQGLPGIWALAAIVENRKFVGAALADGDANYDSTMLDALDDGDEHHRLVAQGYVLTRFSVQGWPWAIPLLEDSGGWSPEKKLYFLLSVDADSVAFSWVDQFGEEVAGPYWANLWPLLVRKGARYKAAMEMSQRGRAHHAVGLIDGILRDPDAELPQDLSLDEMVDLLGQAAADFDGADSTMFAFHVENILDFLQTRPAVSRSQLAQLEWAYLHLLEMRERPPQTLHAELSSNPTFFVDVVSLVFRPEDDDSGEEVTPEVRARAELGYRLLRSWHTPPDSIYEWVTEARQLLLARHLIRVGDINIGHVLRYVPEDDDGIWPSVAVRDLIEEVRSQDLEQGIITEVYNSRGVQFRDLKTGGDAERTLANRYSHYASKLGARWPRARRVVEQIAEQWERDARREDHVSEIREDFWET